MERDRILVVDDDPHTVETVRDILLRAGYEVKTATSGRDALGQLLDHEQPALMIVDIRMPVMDGREFLTVVRAYRRLAAIPVLVLSALDLPPPLAESVEVVMRKPFRPQELVDNVGALLRSGMERDAHR